jgi:hypothetical protein
MYWIIDDESSVIGEVRIWGKPWTVDETTTNGGRRDCHDTSKVFKLMVLRDADFDFHLCAADASEPELASFVMKWSYS